ncbi:bifunctional 4-hydroxy-2-oxoglutarate aldolase/2-dehydro-3-deoxy-phosphogluconate aldolase [Rubrivirga sp. IMCC45206]|uniref:bifunctional 4-hydroxy-2-oxoglutarate aldolase/2-dehydro-3-deoxy-phosphogluconate aldolase n=1 Tax=Rubrivirga sp. IMCC45206 TaxID=3391614 RepID=UPI00398FBDBB
MPSLVRDAVVDRVRALGAVAVVRSQHPDRLVASVEALLEGGVEAIEITLTVPGALGQIRRVAEAFGDRVLLGVGSVTDAETTRQAIEAGARYVVSPVFKPSIIEAAHAHGAAAMPGCFTPTEAQTAWEAGADVVKIFPAGVLGLSFFKGVLAPLPHLRLMPTGGVTLDNAGDWLRAGAVAVGVGGALWDDRAVAAGDYGTLTANARRLSDSIAAARG